MRHWISLGALFVAVATIQLVATVMASAASYGLSDGARLLGFGVARIVWLILSFPHTLALGYANMGRPIDNVWLLHLPNALLWAAVVR